MKIAYDLDGTLYDSLAHVFGVDTRIRERLGYPIISLDDYRRNFQSHDWKKFYRDLGIREEDIDMVVSLFIKENRIGEPPTLIPGAREALCVTEEAIGRENIYIITNEPFEGVKIRFERDGLTHFLQNVDNPFAGKVNEIFRLAQSDLKSPFIYIGDIISDGESCLEARKMGANNVRFYGITHPYAITPRDLMERFVAQNSDFAQVLENLASVNKMWSQSL